MSHPQIPEHPRFLIIEGRDRFQLANGEWVAIDDLCVIPNGQIDCANAARCAWLDKAESESRRLLVDYPCCPTWIEIENKIFDMTRIAKEWATWGKGNKDAMPKM